MRKITGKALAAVLAMALLTSSFSGTFAFAASSERAGSVSFSGDDEVTLVKDTEDPNEYKFDLEGLIGTMTLTTTDKAEKDVAVDSEDLSFRHAKGDNLISIKDGKARVKSDKTGTETIMVYGEATITRDDRDITLKGQKEITIHVVESGYLFVGVKGEADKKVGEEVPALELSYNDLATKNVAVYKAVAGADLKANYEETTVNEDGDPLRIETSSTTRFDVDDEDNVTTIQNRGKGTGTMKLSIKSATGSDKAKFNTTEESTTATILKRIDVTGTVTIDKDGSKTTISPYASAPNMDSDSNVAGYDIKVLNRTNVNVTGSASVGEITDAADVSVEDKAKVGDITDATGTVSISGGTVGALDVKGSVEMSDGTAASIEADENISIVGGTVSGDVLTDKDVTIDAEDDEIDTVVNGKVEATNISVDCSSEDGQIRLAKVVLKDDGELNLTGGNVEITELDCAYEGNVNFVDFQGTLPTILNAQDISVDEDSTVVVKLVVGADKLYVSDSISGDVKLRLAGANVNVGDVAYKAAKDVGSTDAFSGVGFTVERKSVDSNTDSFLVRSVSFAGVALDKSEVTIAKGFSDTVTVSNYPASTSLPAGASIVWDYSDADRDVFDITADGATLTISVKDYDDVYATSNSFELIATVVDSDGYEIEDYDPATCTVTAIPEVVVSSDLSGIVEVPQGSTKDFVVNSQVEAPVTIGTGNVAVHALKTPFANGQATYTIKATGAVGTTAGVYATVPGQNAVKLFIIKVTEPVVTSDTTVDFNLAAGNRYVFKITAPSAPSFTVGNGAVLKTQAGKIDGNDYYFAVYAIGSAGQSTGVYVNGVKVCTVTVG